jgi:hypothetical protein
MPVGDRPISPTFQGLWITPPSPKRWIAPKTFPGIWIYENCPRSDDKNRVVFFEFFYLGNIGFGTFVEG